MNGTNTRPPNTDQYVKFHLRRPLLMNLPIIFLHDIVCVAVEPLTLTLTLPQL